MEKGDGKNWGVIEITLSRGGDELRPRVQGMGIPLFEKRMAKDREIADR